jgi:hypothetical protein
LKNFITILIAFSLYAPSIAKMMAYADCSIQVLSNKEPLLCDCIKIIGLDKIPMSADETNQQQKLSQQTDWKFTVTNQFILQKDITLIKLQFNQFYSSRLPDQRVYSFFHPPAC